MYRKPNRANVNRGAPYFRCILSPLAIMHIDQVTQVIQIANQILTLSDLLKRLAILRNDSMVLLIVLLVLCSV